MNALPDQQLLRDYADSRSEAAFAELVRRHVDFVYSAALRMVCDSHLAQDVCQAVFVALAKNAAQLTDRLLLSGWLHRTTQNIAANAVRSDVRRRAHEQEAAAMNELLSTEPGAVWEHIAPHLDDTLNQLDEADRDVLFLRFFQRKSLREVGAILGTSDDAAQKRVTRAVERLRDLFAKRGITAGATGLATVISAHAVHAAPVGLAVAIVASVALSGAVTTTATVATTMSWITAKTVGAIAAAALAVGTGVYLVQQTETNRLRHENQSLAAANLAAINERESALSNSAANSNELERLRTQQSELLRLRGEVGMLRRQTNDLAKLGEENRVLRSRLAETVKAASQQEVDPESDAQRQAAVAKLNDARLLVLGMIMYASDNQERIPTDLNKTSNYWANAEHHLTGTNQFELVIQGSLTNVPNPSETIAVREKEAWFAKGKWFKTYAFADGHSEVHTEPDGDFEAWERQRMLVQPNRP